MNAQDAEEIDAEAEPVPISIRHMIMGYLESYGWLILFGALGLIFVYRKVVKPKLQAIAEEKELGERKKFDINMQAIYEDKIRAAREKLQHKYTLDAEREKDIQEQKKLEALRRAAEEMGLETQPAVKHTTKPVVPKEFVLELINSTPVVVFSKSFCPYSRKAKQALSTYRLPEPFYKIVELDTMEECIKIQDFLAELTGARSVPRVFVGGKFVGGGDDTVAAHKDGRLHQLLMEAGVISK